MLALSHSSINAVGSLAASYENCSVVVDDGTWVATSCNKPCHRSLDVDMTRCLMTVRLRCALLTLLHK